MKSRKNFQEVALSLTEPGHMLLAGESTPPMPSAAHRMQVSGKGKPPTQASLHSKPSSQVIQVCKPPRVTTCIELDRASVSSTSTMREFDTDSLEIDTTQTDFLSAISAPAQVFLVTAASKHKKNVGRSAAKVDLRLGKELTFAERVDGWERALRTALELDLAGETKEALVAYGK